MLAWVKVSTFSLLKKKKKTKKEREREYSAKRATLFPGLTFFRMNSCTWGWYRETAMVIILYTMQCKVDRFFYWRQFFLLFSDSTVLVINPRTTCKFIPPPWYKGGGCGWTPPGLFDMLQYFETIFNTFKGCDHGYAHARRLSLQNKFVGSALNSKSPLLVQSLKILLFIPTSVALAGLVILW